MNLVTAPNFNNADDFYEALIETHRDLDVAASHALNARLVLLLANHIGATDVLKQALSAAREGVQASAAPPAGAAS
jgi:hypothetical protein